MQIRDKDYGKLYPITLAENVELNNGQTMQKFTDDTNKKFPDDIILWSGSLYPTTGSAKPSKKLSECFRGWELIWKRKSGSSQWQATHIPKIHLSIGKDNGLRHIVAEQDGKGGVTTKYLYATDTEITGHSVNKEGTSGKIALAYVVEY